jgi:hypothetical protein
MYDGRDGWLDRLELMPSGTPREPVVSPLEREPEHEPTSWGQTPQERALALCDRPGFEGGAYFYELFEPCEDLIEPGERRIYSEHELP